MSGAVDGVKSALGFYDCRMASILIVGGGIAGVAAAKTLLDAGIEDVKILEASDKLGGRILTVDLGQFNELFFMKTFMILSLFNVSRH